MSWTMHKILCIFSHIKSPAKSIEAPLNVRWTKGVKSKEMWDFCTVRSELSINSFCVKCHVDRLEKAQIRCMELNNPWGYIIKATQNKQKIFTKNHYKLLDSFHLEIFQRNCSVAHVASSLAMWLQVALCY